MTLKCRVTSCLNSQPVCSLSLEACVIHNCCTELAELEGLALDDCGLQRDQGAINFCSVCLAALSRRRVPPLALKNGLEVGPVPKVLQDLTWAEQRLIAIYNIHLHMVHFRNEEVPGAKQTLDGEQKQPHFRGAAFCVPQDVLSVNKLLPMPPDELTQHLQVTATLMSPFSNMSNQVVFLGANKPTPEQIKMQYALRVSSTRVKAALLWLIKHNALYRKLYNARQIVSRRRT